MSGSLLLRWSFLDDLGYQCGFTLGRPSPEFFVHYRAHVTPFQNYHRSRFSVSHYLISIAKKRRAANG